MATPNQHGFDLSEALRQPPSQEAYLANASSDAKSHDGPASRSTEDALLSNGITDARTWKLTIEKCHPTELIRKYKNADRAIRNSLRKLRKSARQSRLVSDDAKRLTDNSILICTILQDVRNTIMECRDLPGVAVSRSEQLPRAYFAVESYLRTTNFAADLAGVSAYLRGAQRSLPLVFEELWMLGTFSRLVLLEQIGLAAKGLSADRKTTAISAVPSGVSLSRLIRCLRQCADLEWSGVIDEVSISDKILRQDPLAVYSKMDLESRDEYRGVLADLADHSALPEQDIAREAVRLANTLRCGASSRARDRRSHVGYYLVDDGLATLKRAVGYRPSFSGWIRQALVDNPDFFYTLSTQLCLLAVIALAIIAIRVKFITFGELALLFLPAMECALASTNLLVTRFVPPRRLPKLDLANGIPDENTTLVVVPALLMNKEQVEHAVKDLEIRFLGNREANLHFALVTDLPDSMTKYDQIDTLAEFCSSLIDRLNSKYVVEGRGSFFHFHRHRVYNPSEGIWMGWERKRGKLLDLNNLLLGKSDRFPVKVGDLSVLPRVKYVITLDLDTQLPRESARKLIGALAHPLNKAVIDPITNTVVEGYGILQPRVEISIKSASRSRLAAMFSTDTRLDIYTHAVSDVYHDLFGEGIFAGKGIYEVATFQKVLEHRFPCNAILSHDLIEGAYVRTGLVSDIEIIDDYPTHTSAYSRRKHRWIRGDWQILFWLFPSVPDYFGKFVPNPLRPLSRWKIADNLRRSLTECATFFLLIYGFFHVPQKALEWTLACIAILAFPMYLHLGLTVILAGRPASTARFWKKIGSDFGRAQAELFSRLILLCHQTFVTLDAIVRAVVRMTFTHKRLLQWETAAQAELASGAKDPVEKYFFWTSALSFAVGIFLALLRPASLAVGLPFLAFWSLSVLFCRWLDRPLGKNFSSLRAGDKSLLRRASLRTWRFFSEFCTADENWLIPDVITQAPVLVAHRISPTNLGLLLDSRIAAYDLGFLTIQEFVETTERTMATAASMVKCNGHFYNWYDTQTLEPVNERFISSVDSGNLLCSLWTLKQACDGAGKEPLFRKAIWEGICDHLQIVQEHVTNEDERSGYVVSILRLRARLKLLGWSSRAWIQTLPELQFEIANFEKAVAADEKADANLKWWAGECLARAACLSEMVESVIPWFLAPLRDSLNAAGIRVNVVPEELTLESSIEIHARLVGELQNRLQSGECTPQVRSAIENALVILLESARATLEISAKLSELSSSVASLADGMDFGCLFNPAKKMLSIGLDVEEGRQKEYHYDLLASEARSAVFVAIAKGDIPQESWFKLGRTQATRENKRVLLSWSGTMFEYLMPALWMKSYPNTLLGKCADVAVRAQQRAARSRSIPWGISESSCVEKIPTASIAITLSDCLG